MKIEELEDLIETYLEVQYENGTYFNVNHCGIYRDILIQKIKDYVEFEISKKLLNNL